MLDCGWGLKDDVDKFVFQIAMNETGDKCQKLAALQLSPEEWNRVDLFLNLLAHAEHSQQKFSSDLKSTLHLALPALETLHAGWTKCACEGGRVLSENLKFECVHVCDGSRPRPEAILLQRALARRPPGGSDSEYGANIQGAVS
ncbi:hypothetical protein B0H10DRAFT_1103321 [Mycena sp. CBHHK59/15]|nr:hypothetical protein B0H10DRAFT_1103321 [Mycena sp. CBHHK59/15]